MSRAVTDGDAGAAACLHIVNEWEHLAAHLPGALFQLKMTPAGRVTLPFVSPVAADLFQRGASELQSNLRLLLARIHRRDRWRLRQGLRYSARHLTSWRAEFRVAIAPHGWCWRELVARPVHCGDAGIVWHGFTHDISERKRAEESRWQSNRRLEQLAHYDALTGLPSRALWRDRLDQAMRQSAIDAHDTALLFIDLDRFQDINDRYGHAAGDTLLALAAERIVAQVRPGDTVARLAGDAFAVILAARREPAQLEQAAQAIVDAVRMPFQLGAGQVCISGSAGIALYPRDGRVAEELMRNADHALVRAKAAGRDQLAFFEPSRQRAAMDRLKLHRELGSALDARQLELHFQPILDNRTGLVSKAEALLRWRRPGHGMVLPRDFLGVAEETGLIHTIGNWVFAEAARWSAHWSRTLGHTLQVSINTSPLELLQRSDSAGWIAGLDRQGLPHSSIAVELTEAALAHLPEAAWQRLHALRQGGVAVSIDDFGTGHSSMAELNRLSIACVKIDPSFVAGMLNDPASLTITETIIVMAHKLGVKVIAEGVETTAQRACLRTHGCDFVQGYLFARPMPPGAFEKLLLRQPFQEAGAH
jgi:diguanylate cyclase (GGDEF)-like protein